MIIIDGKTQNYNEVCDVCGEKLWVKTETGWSLLGVEINSAGKFHKACKP